MDGWERRGKGAKADGRRAGWSPFQPAAEKGRPTDLEFSWGGDRGGSRAAGVPSIRNLGSDSRVGCGGPAPQCGHLGSACLASAGRRPIGWLLLAARNRTNEPARCFKNSGPLLLLERTPSPSGPSVWKIRMGSWRCGGIPVNRRRQPEPRATTGSRTACCRCRDKVCSAASSSGSMIPSEMIPGVSILERGHPQVCWCRRLVLDLDQLCPSNWPLGPPESSRYAEHVAPLPK